MNNPRLFFRVPDSGEPAVYCGGPSMSDMMQGVKRHLEMEIYEMGFDGGPIHVEFFMQDLTDEEVEALPEL